MSEKLLEVKNLRVSYHTYAGEVQSVRGVSFTVNKGETVAVVGESGCGKRTIAALLSGSRTGYTGSVPLGGVPVEQLQRAQRLRALTLVPHNATIFKGTVEANLRMAKPDATEAELWAALEQVNLADFCRSQDGLQTALHEGGSNLSGGQRQRLAMARALLHDTPIYLFDEATSNVDAESENDIMAAIRSLAGRKTVILISHRLANVVDSDCIYVLENGGIAEQGTHAQLLAQRGAYCRLYTAQKQLDDSIYGIEKKPFPYLLCGTNMLLHDIEVPNIYHMNSLKHNLLDYTDEDKFDVILMNPPYGGHEDKSIQGFFPDDLASSETAALFLSVIMYRLKKNGSAADVVPDGFLFGLDNAKVNIKKKLISQFNLHTVIRLPGSVFSPYTSITTNLLFFDNTKPTSETWFYRVDIPSDR